MRRALCLGALAALCVSSPASAQYGQPPPGYGQPPPGYGQAPPGYGQAPPGYGQAPPGYGQAPPGYGQAPPGYGRPSAPPSKYRTDLEVGTLYVMSAAYGVGMGSWISIEAGISDPAVFLIPPALLGIGGPVGVYLLDDPSMHKGMPASIAAGLAIGAGEGIGIASYQYVTADEADAGDFRTLSRATALGATLGGVGGYLVGYYQEPAPESVFFTSSGVLWGTFIGSSFGYGLSQAGVGYGLANDRAALGGLVGYNLGLGGAAALGAVWVPSWNELLGMWVGAGIGAAASLPVFLFYTGGDGPPAKRGLIFTGAATSIGLVAGGLLSSDRAPSVGRGPAPRAHALAPRRWFTLTNVGPMALPRGAGVSAGGVLD